MLYPSRAYISLAHKYRDVSEVDYRSVVLPCYAEVVYRRHGYAHARLFKARAIHAHRIYSRAKRSANPPLSRLRTQTTPRPSQPPKSLQRQRRHRNGHSRRKVTPPPEPPDLAAHTATLRKVVGIHSCEECLCSESHALVRITGVY